MLFRQGARACLDLSIIVGPQTARVGYQSTVLLFYLQVKGCSTKQHGFRESASPACGVAGVWSTRSQPVWFFFTSRSLSTTKERGEPGADQKMVTDENSQPAANRSNRSRATPKLKDSCFHPGSASPVHHKPHLHTPQHTNITHALEQKTCDHLTKLAFTYQETGKR